MENTPFSAVELTLLIPALNEAGSLITLLPAIKEALRQLGVAHEIVVVDGGSTDATAAVAEQQGARVFREHNSGFGGALRRGFKEAQGQFIMVMDADGSHPTETIPKLWKLRDHYDLAVASRYIHLGAADMPLLRQILSRSLNFVMRLVLGFPVRDSSSGFRLYRASAIKNIPLSRKDFSIQQEILAHFLKSGKKVKEIPFHYHERIAGETKARVFPLSLSYLEIFFTLNALQQGWASMLGLFFILLLGLSLGLCGIRWGLPGPARLRAFPEQLQPTPAIAEKLAQSWANLYQEIESSHRQLSHEEPVTYVKGVEEITPNWNFPPKGLDNAYRSLLLQSENPDEKKSFIILGQMRPWKLDFKPLYVQYGGSYIYPLGIFLAAASLFAGFPHSSNLRYFLLHPSAMGNAYLAGRIFILLIHLATLWLLFNFGKRLSGWKTGFLAALFFLLMPLTVVNSHILKPHPYAAFFCLAAFYFMLSALKTGQRSNYWLCGLCAGWAAGANAACIVFAVLPLLACLMRERATPMKWQDWLWPVSGAALAAATVLAVNPYLLASFRDYLWETTVYVPSSWQLQLSGLIPMLCSVIPQGLGWPTWLLSVAGLLRWGLGRQNDRRLLALVFLFSFLFFWAKFWYIGHTSGSLRLYYPLLGIICLAAADFLTRVRLPQWLKTAIVGLTLFVSGLQSYVYLANMSLDSSPHSTRMAAAQWIEEHAAPGSSVGLVRYPEPAHSPYLRYDLYHLVIFSDAEKLSPQQMPDYIVVDQEGLPAISDLTQKNYQSEQVFSPLSAGWAKVTDDSFYANESLYVFRRNNLPAK